MAAGMEPPRRMFIHGYLLMGEKKMSKSLGNVLDPFEVIERFGADALRFYCFREVSFGQDGSVSAAGFEQRYETELANDWGNLASRTLAMIERYRDGVVPEAGAGPRAGRRRRRLRGRRRHACASCSTSAELTQALEEIWARVRRLNRYVEETRPWDLAKDDGRAPSASTRCSTTSPRACGCWRCCCSPYLPDTSGRLLEALAEGNRELAAFGSRPGGQAIERPGPLFPKLEAGTSRLIDSHAHLGLCEPDDAELVSAAAAAGVTPDPHRRARRGLEPRARSPRREAHEGVFAAVGRHPNSADRLRRRGGRATLAELAGRPRGRGRRRDGARLLPRRRAARRPAARVRRPDRDRPAAWPSRW